MSIRSKLVGVSFVLLLSQYVSGQAPACPYGKSQDSRGCLLLALKSVAGANAIDCGTVGLREDAADVNKCILQSKKSRTPFFARYEVWGMDSDVMDAVAGDGTGKLFVAISDSVGLVEQGHYDEAKFVILDSCDKPKHKGIAQGLTDKIPIKCKQKH